MGQGAVVITTVSLKAKEGTQPATTSSDDGEAAIATRLLILSINSAKVTIGKNLSTTMEE